MIARSSRHVAGVYQPIWMTRMPYSSSTSVSVPVMGHRHSRAVSQRPRQRRWRAFPSRRHHPQLAFRPPSGRAKRLRAVRETNPTDQIGGAVYRLIGRTTEHRSDLVRRHSGEAKFVFEKDSVRPQEYHASSSEFLSFRDHIGAAAVRYQTAQGIFHKPRPDRTAVGSRQQNSTAANAALTLRLSNGAEVPGIWHAPADCGRTLYGLLNRFHSTKTSLRRCGHCAGMTPQA
jgi:hypothetical protein